MGAAAAVPAILAIASTIGSKFAARKGQEARDEALDARMQQEKVAEAARSSKRLDRVKSIISSNLATAGAHGVSPASGSFKAINENVYNNFDEDENADALNLQYRANYVNQLENIGSETNYISAFGDIASLGEDFFRTSAPSGKS